MRALQVTKLNTRLKRWSWGEFEFDFDVVGPYKTSNRGAVPFTKEGCGGYLVNGRGSYNLGGGCLGTPTNGINDYCGRDTLGAEAALLQDGINVNNYDYQTYWQPPCGQLGFAGAASVGGTKVILNGPGGNDNSDYWAKVLGHEIGHNCTAAMRPQ